MRGRGGERQCANMSVTGVPGAQTRERRRRVVGHRGKWVLTRCAELCPATAETFNLTYSTYHTRRDSKSESPATGSNKQVLGYHLIVIDLTTWVHANQSL